MPDDDDPDRAVQPDRRRIEGEEQRQADDDVGDRQGEHDDRIEQQARPADLLRNDAVSGQCSEQQRQQHGHRRDRDAVDEDVLVADEDLDHPVQREAPFEGGAPVAAEGQEHDDDHGHHRKNDDEQRHDAVGYLHPGGAQRLLLSCVDHHTFFRIRIKYTYMIVIVIAESTTDRAEAKSNVS